MFASTSTSTDIILSVQQSWFKLAPSKWDENFCFISQKNTFNGGLIPISHKTKLLPEIICKRILCQLLLRCWRAFEIYFLIKSIRSNKISGNNNAERYGHWIRRYIEPKILFGQWFFSWMLKETQKCWTAHQSNF